MKIILTVGLAVISLAVRAQQKEGKVIYERTVQMQVNFSGMNEEMQRMVPRSRTDKFDLIFGNGQSLYKQADPDNEDENTFGGESGGLQFRMMTAGSNDVIYTNFETGKKVELREIMDRKFIVDDSISPLKWKMTGESKTILNHVCMKATTTQVLQRTQVTMNNGSMERRRISDTSLIVAWFATDIPVPAGPAEYQGQLPGLILEMDIANGRQVFRALNIEPRADIASIREPGGKKRYTAEEFRKEREKMTQEMQRNGGGQRREFRMN